MRTDTAMYGEKYLARVGLTGSIHPDRDLLDELRRTPGVASIDQAVLTRLYKDYSWTGLRDRSGERAQGGGGVS